LKFIETLLKKLLKNYIKLFSNIFIYIEMSENEYEYEDNYESEIPQGVIQRQPTKKAAPKVNDKRTLTSRANMEKARLKKLELLKNKKLQPKPVVQNYDYDYDYEDESSSEEEVFEIKPRKPTRRIPARPNGRTNAADPYAQRIDQIEALLSQMTLKKPRTKRPPPKRRQAPIQIINNPPQTSTPKPNVVDYFAGSGI